MLEEALQEEAARYITVVDNHFKGLIAEKKLRKLPTENLLLNASYLVEKTKQNDFKQTFARLRGLQGDLEYQFTGPWPPYNFIVLNKRHYNWVDNR